MPPFSPGSIPTIYKFFHLCPYLGGEVVEKLPFSKKPRDETQECDRKPSNHADYPCDGVDIPVAPVHYFHDDASSREIRQNPEPNSAIDEVH